LAPANLRPNTLAQIACLRLRSFAETLYRAYTATLCTNPGANWGRHHAAACLRLRSFV